MDGWFDEEGSNQPSCFSARSPPGLFDMQRVSFCRVETGCVPGLGGLDYSEVDTQRMSSTSTTPQRQFYRNIQNYPSSTSSSSLRSFSGGSSECSSLIMSKPNCVSHLRETNPREASMERATHQRRSSSPVPLQQAITMQPYGHSRSAQFPTSTGDDETMARAMLAVISSSSSSASSIHPPIQRQERRRGGAFQPYDPSLNIPCRTEGKQVAQGQQMIKRGFSILRWIRDQMSAEEQMPEARPTSNQLHHMISERRRREKLNESFAALRTLLPPGTKGDKASVLASTIDIVNSLKTQISTLEEKNRVMAARLLLLGETDEMEVDASGDDKRTIRSVQILRSTQSSIGQQQLELKVTVRAECDVIDLVLHMLEFMKEMRGVELVSLDASIIRTPHMMNPVRRAIFTLQIMGDDHWDESSFQEAITGVVDEALAAAPPAAAP